MKLSEIVLSHGDANESTTFPIWAIARETRKHEWVWIAGPWFNRDDAQSYFESRRHNFPKSAEVFCFSGHASWHLKEIYALAKLEAAS